MLQAFRVKFYCRALVFCDNCCRTLQNFLCKSLRLYGFRTHPCVYYYYPYEMSSPASLLMYDTADEHPVCVNVMFMNQVTLLM